MNASERRAIASVRPSREASIRSQGFAASTWIRAIRVGVRRVSNSRDTGMSRVPEERNSCFSNLFPLTRIAQR